MKNWSSYRWGEAGVAAVLIGLGVYMAIAALKMPAGSIAQPGPAAFPLVIGALLVAIGGAIILGLGLRGRTNKAAPMGREGAIIVATLIAAAAVFELAGALATFAGLLFVLHLALARRAWWKSALFGIAGAAVAWAVFVLLLGVSLPGPSL